MMASAGTAPAGAAKDGARAASAKAMAARARLARFAYFMGGLSQSRVAAAMAPCKCRHFPIHTMAMPRRARTPEVVAFLVAALAGLLGAPAAALPASETAKPFDLADRAFILCWHSFLGQKNL